MRIVLFFTALIPASVEVQEWYRGPVKLDQSFLPGLGIVLLTVVVLKLAGPTLARSA